MSFPFPNDNLLYQEVSAGPRQWFNNQSIINNPDYVAQMFDFNRPTDLSSSDWTTVKDAGAAVAVGTDAENGTCVITSTATTDADGGSVQSIQKCYQLATGKKLWFEVRAKLSDATQSTGFYGLTVAFSTNPENVLTAANSIGFAKGDGATTLNFSCTSASVNQLINCNSAWVADTYKVLSFYWNGAGTVQYFVDRSYAGQITSGIPSATAMGLVLEALSGDTVGTHTSTIDYVMVIRER